MAKFAFEWIDFDDSTDFEFKLTILVWIKGERFRYATSHCCQNYDK